MLKPQDNERLVRVGPETPMGNLLRRYWQPALLSSELPDNDGAPVRVRLFGEDLIAFRDTSGAVGFLDAFCPHRRAPMFFARNEQHGLRCIYHGWKFDIQGKCVDLPNVADTERVAAGIKIVNYPAYEGGGVVWIYMGPKEKQPPHPDFEWMRAPERFRHVSKTHQDCNYLQALEGGLDTAHTSFLHNEDIGAKTLRNEDGVPKLEIFPTSYGYSYVSFRRAPGDANYVRVYQYMMPYQQLRGFISDDYGNRKKMATVAGHFWVPIDDYTTTTWNLLYAADENVPFTREFAEEDEKRTGRGSDDMIPGTFQLKRNKSNDYMVDRELQKRTYSGIVGINTQDIALQEGMGAIVDRSKESLVGTDLAIVTMRRMLLEATHAVERGEDPPGIDSTSTRAVRGFDSVVPAGADWQSELKDKMSAHW